MPSFSKPLFQNFNFGLALSLGVVALWVVDRDRKNIVDLITGQTNLIPANTATVVGTPEGLALNFNNIASVFSITHPAVSGLSCGKYVLLARARPTAQQSNGVNAIFGVSATSAATLNGSGVGWDNTAIPKAGGLSNGSGGGAMEGTRTTGVNVFSTLICTGEGGVTPKSWCDGTPLTGQFDVGGTLANVDKISFGSMLDSAGAVLQGCKGDLLWAAIIKTTTVGTVLFKDANAWQLYSGDFPYNLFRQSRRPFRVSGGNVYNVSISEAGSAAETVSSSATLPSAVNDNATAAETVASSAILPSAVSEGLTGADTVASSATLPSSLSDGPTAADTVSNTAILPSTIAEVASASDSPSTPGGNSTVTDALSATDQYSSTVNVNSSVSDVLTATNAQNAAGLVASVSVAEIVTPTDAFIASLIAASSVGETVSVFDAYLAAAIFNASVAEALTATDIYTASAGVIKPGKCDSLDVPFIVRSLKIPAIVRSLGVGCA